MNKSRRLETDMTLGKPLADEWLSARVGQNIQAGEVPGEAVGFAVCGTR